jgi:Asp-tRNA(Asn)/Glu-tRNA(Gln) amidotransferase A subunit family amidase
LFGCFWAFADAAEGATRARPLKGVGVKNAFDVAGFPTTGGIAGFGQLAEADSGLIRLLREAGATVVGKTAIHELGWRMSSQSPGVPTCRNPRAPDRMPGASSSGSAAAVAAGLVSLGIGANTAGSICVPAAWCGVVGYMPSSDVLPRDGLLPLVPLFDRPGLLASSVWECVAALRSTGVPISRAPVHSPWVGVLEALFESEPEIEFASRVALDRWHAAGAEMEGADLGWNGSGLGAVYAFELATRWSEAVDAHPDRLAPDVLAGVAYGRTVHRSEYEAMLAALPTREEGARQRVQGLDVVICPTIPIQPPLLGDSEPVAAASRNPRALNALGFAAISIPCPVDGLPVGLQVAASRGGDDVLLGVALALEKILA